MQPARSLLSELKHKAGEAAFEGDLAWYDQESRTVRSAAVFPDSGDGPTQAAFASAFVGVLASKQLASDSVAQDAAIETDAVWLFPCESATFHPGDLVTVSYAGGALNPNKLKKTTETNRAIGTVLASYASATTTVLVRLTSKRLTPYA